MECLGNKWKHLTLIVALVSSLCQATGPFAPLDTQWTPPSQEQVANYKLQKLIQTLLRSRPLKGKDTVVASTCRQTLVLSDFLDRKELLPKPGDKQIPVLAADLDAPPNSVHDIFKLIRLTVLGRAILKKFMPRYGFDISVKFDAKSSIQDGTQNSAVASFNSKEKRIRISRNAKLGSVAYVLLHEIIHAMDVDFVSGLSRVETLNKVYQEQIAQIVSDTAERAGKPGEQLFQWDYNVADIERLIAIRSAADQMQDILIFRAERFAYDASYDVWKSLATLFPNYYTNQKKREITSRFEARMDQEPYFHTDDQIIELNDLNLAVINRYKSGLCIPYSGNAKKFFKIPAGK